MDIERCPFGCAAEPLPGHTQCMCHSIFLTMFRQVRHAQTHLKEGEELDISQINRGREGNILDNPLKCRVCGKRFAERILLRKAKERRQSKKRYKN